MELNCLKSKETVKQQFSTFLTPRPPTVQHNIQSILAKIFSRVFLIFIVVFKVFLLTKTENIDVKIN